MFLPLKVSIMICRVYLRIVSYCYVHCCDNEDQRAVLRAQLPVISMLK